MHLLVASAAFSRVSKLNNGSVSMHDKCFKPLLLSVASQPAQAWATSLSGQVKQLDVRPLGPATVFSSKLNFQLLTSGLVCLILRILSCAIPMQISPAHTCLMK